jgi:prenyltransferase beta subunit
MGLNRGCMDNMSRRVFLASLAAAPAVWAGEQPGGVAPVANQLTGNEITDKQRAAVEKGLTWLASQQAPDGSYSQESSSGAHAGITALAGIAFMAAGNLPNRGKYGQAVQKVLQFIMACCQESGLVASQNSNGLMYGHGFATLFLGEICGMSPDEEVKEKLERAVRLIERVQNKEGGWRYEPIPNDADISVTICQVMALRAARDAGIKVSKEVIDNAIKYVRRCQNADGGFSYQAGQGTSSGFARTAAGVATLYYAGVFEGNDLKRGLDYIKQSNNPAGDSYFFYGNYYASQATFLAGGEYWEKYYPRIRDQLVQSQIASGAWTQNSEAGAHYGTAMALIILQMPNRYLPVFHGKGPGQ